MAVENENEPSLSSPSESHRAFSASKGNTFQQKQEGEGSFFREIVEDMMDFANDKQSQESGKETLKGCVEMCGK